MTGETHIFVILMVKDTKISYIKSLVLARARAIYGGLVAKKAKMCYNKLT